MACAETGTDFDVGLTLLVRVSHVSLFDAPSAGAQPQFRNLSR